MTFLWPQFLWFLLLIPILLLISFLAARRRQKTSQKFADGHLLPQLIKRPARGLTRLTVLLQFLALAALLTAAARPQASIPLQVNKAAVVIAIDASRSMLADDVEPSRLAKAIELAQRFVDQVPGSTQIGLVSFSDMASVLVPPTTDRDLLRDAIAQLEAAQNTSLASAVVAGVRMLPGREGVLPPEELEPQTFSEPETPTQNVEANEDLAPGSILIFSDGVSNVSSNPELSETVALDIAGRFARDNEVSLYTFALGKSGGTVANIDGQDYFIPFEPDNLERLADFSDGKAIDADDEDEVFAVVKELGRVMRWEFNEMEVSSLLSGFALILMLVAAGLSLRLQRRVP